MNKPHEHTSVHASVEVEWTTHVSNQRHCNHFPLPYQLFEFDYCYLLLPLIITTWNCLHRGNCCVPAIFFSGHFIEHSDNWPNISVDLFFMAFTSSFDGPRKRKRCDWNICVAATGSRMYQNISIVLPCTHAVHGKVHREMSKQKHEQKSLCEMELNWIFVVDTMRVVCLSQCICDDAINLEMICWNSTKFGFSSGKWIAPVRSVAGRHTWNPFATREKQFALTKSKRNENCITF